MASSSELWRQQAYPGNSGLQKIEEGESLLVYATTHGTGCLHANARAFASFQFIQTPEPFARPLRLLPLHDFT
jgi:hypothetical protein